jgi:hypothetical protein
MGVRFAISVCPHFISLEPLNGIKDFDAAEVCYDLSTKKLRKLRDSSDGHRHTFLRSFRKYLTLYELAQKILERKL